MEERFVNKKYIVAIFLFHAQYGIEFIASAIIYSATNYSACDTFMASTAVNFNMCRLNDFIIFVRAARQKFKTPY